MIAEAGVDTALGRLGIRTDGDVITGLDWQSDAPPPATPLEIEAARQLHAYFNGDLTTFNLPLAPASGDFQQRVQTAMQHIPYGRTRTYGDLAKALGTPPQPIGQACGANPIPIIIPCHRVLGTNGVGGFSGWGGVETKIWLLRHEGAYGFLV